MDTGAIAEHREAVERQWTDTVREHAVERHAVIAHAADGDVDFFWIVGGNFLETLGDESRSRAALARPRLRVHQDIVLSTSMLADSDVRNINAHTEMFVDAYVDLFEAGKLTGNKPVLMKNQE